MSTSNLSLTQDEQTLHHYAAMLEKELEAYHACIPRDEKKTSVDYYFGANRRGSVPPRIHPLLLSLMEVIREGGTSVKISSVSVKDPRILMSNYYTSPTDLPPLNIHLPGQNASCQECMDSLASVGGMMINMPSAASSPAPIAPGHQENPAGGNIMTTSVAASGLEPMASEPQEPSAEIGNPRAPIPRRKKDSYASGSGVRNVLRNKIAKEIVTRSAAKRSAADDTGEAAISTTYKTRRRAGVNNPSAARPNIKGKGEQDKRTSSRKGKPLHPEEDPDNWEDEAQPLNKPMGGTNEEASPAKEIVTRSAAKRSVADGIGEAAISTTYKTRRHAGNNNPNAARPNIKGKRKQDMKTSSRKGKPLHPEEDLDNNREVEAQPLNKPMEGTNEEASPAEGEDNNNIVKQLEREVQSLKVRCDWQEKTIKDLKSRCDSHEKVLESLRQQIAHQQDECMGIAGQYMLVRRVQI
ncbi:hypothetical protein H4582DRAFT_2063068 [Lactarius indigo]|nr:hypothetical protein H4582DRAFT_2063068 [Lactarius indigo]